MRRENDAKWEKLSQIQKKKHRRHKKKHPRFNLIIISHRLSATLGRIELIEAIFLSDLVEIFTKVEKSYAAAKLADVFVDSNDKTILQPYIICFKSYQERQWAVLYRKVV